MGTSVAFVPVADPKQLPFVSVLIPVRNEADSLAGCLECVLAQDYPPDKMEILVVDGRSTDNSRQIIRALACRHPNLQLYDNPKQITSAGLNIALAASRGQVLARVDGHCRIAPDYLRQCIRALDESGAQCVGGTLRPRSESFWEHIIALALGSRFGVGDSQYHYSNKAGYVDQVYLGTMPRAVVQMLGGFDETLVRNQDYEFNYRIRASGGRVYLSPDIRSWYRPRGSIKSFATQYFDYGYWKLRMLRKHPQSVRPRQLAAPLFVLALVLIPLLSLIDPRWLWLGLGVIVLYLGACVLAAAAASRQNWKFIFALPLAFATMHLAWGTGFLLSIIRLAADTVS